MVLTPILARESHDKTSEYGALITSSMLSCTDNEWKFPSSVYSLRVKGALTTNLYPQLLRQSTQRVDASGIFIVPASANHNKGYGTTMFGMTLEEFGKRFQLRGVVFLWSVDPQYVSVP